MNELRELGFLRTLLAERHLVDDETGCWNWQLKGRTKQKNPYGTVWHEGRMQMAHRVYYEILVGEIPEGLTLDHLCRNTLCVNPDHLEPVSMRENILRSDGLTAINARKTHCHRGHADWEVHKQGKKIGRRCITCRRERDLAYYYKRKDAA